MSPKVNLPPRDRFRVRLTVCPASRSRHGIWITKTLSACRFNRDPASVGVNHILAHSLWPVSREDIEARAAAIYAQ